MLLLQLFIGNIPHECTREDIHKFCETVGPLHALHIPPAKVAGSKNPGYAFAMYKSRITAAEAIEQLAGQSIPASVSRPLVCPVSPPLLSVWLAERTSGLTIDFGMRRSILFLPYHQSCAAKICVHPNECFVVGHSLLFVDENYRGNESRVATCGRVSTATA
jgi:hypothetical protein